MENIYDDKKSLETNRITIDVDDRSKTFYQLMEGIRELFVRIEESADLPKVINVVVYCVETNNLDIESKLVAVINYLDELAKKGGIPINLLARIGVTNKVNNALSQYTAGQKINLSDVQPQPIKQVIHDSPIKLR